MGKKEVKVVGLITTDLGYNISVDDAIVTRLVDGGQDMVLKVESKKIKITLKFKK